MNELSEWTEISLTRSLTRSLDPSLRWKLPILNNSADQCVRLSQSIAEKGDISKALLSCFVFGVLKLNIKTGVQTWNEFFNRDTQFKHVLPHI